jgi:outer membrane lipopolysaccharide assembly protein LptE/RlpB
LRTLALVLCAASLAGCGYHVGAQGDMLPKDLRTIAILPWGNGTTQYKLSGYMSQAVSREFLSRTRYNVVADPAKADATLSGSIVNTFTSATIYDPASGRGTGAQITVVLQVRLVGKDGKVLFNRPNLEFRDRYELAIDPRQYIDESQATLERISRDVARTVVSSILENF